MRSVRTISAFESFTTVHVKTKDRLREEATKSTPDKTSKKVVKSKPTAIMVAYELSDRDLDRIVEMGWEDRTPFDQIKMQFGLSEGQVIKIMRKQMKPSSFRMWRKRVQGRSTKHLAKRGYVWGNFKCSRQGHINNNKISKR